MPQAINTAKVDAYLTSLSINYMQDQSFFIADKVFPTVPVAKQSDLILIYDKGAFFRDEVVERPLGGKSPVVTFKTSNDSYFCKEEGLSSEIDDRERANYTPPHDPEKSRILLLTQKHLIHRDAAWASTYFKTGVWTFDKTGKSANPSTNEFLQFDNASSNPVAVIDAYKEQMLETTGYLPNTMVVGRKAFRAMKNNPVILDLIKYTQRAQVTEEILASLFGVQKFLVPGGIQTTTVETEAGTDTFGFIVGSKDILLCYAAPNPGLDMPSAGYTFAWTGLLGAQAFNSNVVVNRGREERNHSDWFEVRMAAAQKKMCADLGMFLKDCVA